MRNLCPGLSLNLFLNLFLNLCLNLGLGVLIGLVPAGARGSGAAAATPEDAARYAACIETVEKAPSAGLEKGMVWSHEGGGAAAEHCVALALLPLGRPVEAAQKLEKLALAPGAGGSAERAALLDQAGNAWLLAGRPDEADVVFTSALDLAPDNPDIYIDRASVQRLKGNWPLALKDLDAALALAPDSVEALVLRAAARRESGDLNGAAADIARALELDPSNVEALVEQGRQRELAAGRPVP